MNRTGHAAQEVGRAPHPLGSSPLLFVTAIRRFASAGNDSRIPHGRQRLAHHLGLEHGRVLLQRRLLLHPGRAQPGKKARAAKRQSMARAGGGGPAARPHGRPHDVREGAQGVCPGDGHPARPNAQRHPPAPPGGGHHALAAEIGLSGGACAGGQHGPVGARGGGARGARLHRARAPGDAGVRPGHQAPRTGAGWRIGGRLVSPRRKPRRRSAAAHALCRGQHDPRPGRRLAEAWTWAVCTAPVT